MRRRGNADHTISVEGLVEARLDVVEHSAAARIAGDGAGDPVAGAVGVPDKILVLARKLPGDFVAGSCLLRADCRPASRLPSHNGSAVVPELRASAASNIVKIKVVANLDQSGRTQRLDRTCSRTPQGEALRGAP